MDGDRLVKFLQKLEEKVNKLTVEVEILKKKASWKKEFVNDVDKMEDLRVKVIGHLKKAQFDGITHSTMLKKLYHYAPARVVNPVVKRLIAGGLVVKSKGVYYLQGCYGGEVDIRSVLRRS